MMTFRKISAASAGRLVRAYYHENTPEPAHDLGTDGKPYLDSGGRLTSYYTGRDTRGTWRPDMPAAIAEALGIDPHRSPKDSHLERLFEGKRADTGEAWPGQQREISAYDLTLAPDKSVSLAIEFAKSPAEQAMLWHALDRAANDTLHYAARELGNARKGKGGMDGADPGAVAWIAIRHHVARPTLHVEDGPTGITYLTDLPIPGDPHAHLHNLLFNAVATASGRVGSLDTKELNHRVHEFGAYFHARLAMYLREIGVRTALDAKGEAVILPAIPQAAVDAFSKGRRQTQRNAKALAEKQGLNWDELPAERKHELLNASAVLGRHAKGDDRTQRQIWLDQAAALGWNHATVLEDAKAPALSEAERFDRAYAFAVGHLAQDFQKAAVIDHTRLSTLAARGLIGVGIQGGIADIDRVVELIEQRGIQIEGEHAALITGVIDERLRVTNTAQLRIEETLAAKARAAARDKSGALTLAAVNAAIASSGIDFDGEEGDHGAAQKKVIRALATGGALGVLTGPAGSGKTTLLRPLVAAYRADTRLSPEGRDIIGIATGWKQTEALDEARITRRRAVDPFLRSVREAEEARANGLGPEIDALKTAGVRQRMQADDLIRRIADNEITLSPNTVLIIDEVSQVGARAMLRLLELREKHGFTIKGLGDREQCQSIEAGDTIGILQKTLPKDALPELSTTVRQRGATREETRRLRMIAGLFRSTEPDPSATPEQRKKQHLAEVALALRMKREDGTARLIGGDQDQVVGRIADFYIERRDALRARGDKRGVTLSALTNEDAADLSRAVRERLKARGEIGGDERVFEAIDRRGEAYQLALAPGDKVRLFRKTWATIDGKGASIGSNGDVVDIMRWTGDGVVLRDKNGAEGSVEWKRLTDEKTKRLLLGFGHAVTIDASQGSTTGEHINAMPRGSAGASSFKSYTAESRHVYQVHTLIAETAVFESIRHRRALGDIRPITTEDVWGQIAEDMSRKDYKSIGLDLLDRSRRPHEQLLSGFLDLEHRAFLAAERGRPLGAAIHARLREDGIVKGLQKQLTALDEALARNGEAVSAIARRAKVVLRTMREQTVDIATRGVAAMRARRERDAAPSPSPSPG